MVSMQPRTRSGKEMIDGFFSRPRTGNRKTEIELFRSACDEHKKKYQIEMYEGRGTCVSSQSEQRTCGEPGGCGEVSSPNG
jgi:hypothetical protein